jgi:phosphopantetheinyl transferase (holo-ACP synthase)
MLSVSKVSKRILLEIHGSCEKKTSTCELGHQDLVLCSSLEIFHLPRMHPTVHYLQQALEPYPANKFFDTIKEFSLSLSLSHTHTHTKASALVIGIAKLEKP